MNKITLIGDVHQKYSDYRPITKYCDYSVQVGDMGFSYHFLSQLDHKKHVFISGNHDNHDCLRNTDPNQGWVRPSHYLGEYGIKTHNGVEFFYIGGAFSIDRKYREKYERATGIKTRWENEELSSEELNNAFELYCSLKPQIMITHECPRQISDIIGNPAILREFGFDPETFTNRTSEWLQKCYEAWQPKLWVFGHYHLKADFYYNPLQPKDKVINLSHFPQTRFICLPELGTIEIDSAANVHYKNNKKDNRMRGQTAC